MKKHHGFWSKRSNLSIENQTTLSLITIMINQDSDKAKDQVYLQNPELARGQDLVKAESRTPKEILLNRIKRQEEQLERLKMMR